MIMFGTTIPLSARIFLSGQINLLASRGHDVVLAYGTDEPGPIAKIDPRVVQVAVPMNRDPAPLRDCGSLLRMIRLIRRLRPETVAFGTPKMGLLGLLAAVVCRVPRRVYVLFGLRLEGSSGLRARILAQFERFAMACATEVLSISESNRQRVLELGLTKPHKIAVLGEGGLGGLDLDGFRQPTEEERLAARERWGLPAEAPVVGFIGRLTPDKGIGDLASMWAIVSKSRPDARLLVIGPDESTKSGHGHLVTTLEQVAGVIRHGPITDPENAYAAMDVLVLLTKREGFGQVLIEAAACGVPSVASRVSGTVDAVVDGVTGTLVELGDIEAAATATLTYLADEQLRATHGQAGSARAAASFSTEHLDQLWADHLAPST